MHQTIGIGVIGMGWMGQVHSRSYRAIVDRFPASKLRPQLVICADDAPARLSDVKDQFGFAEVSEDWRQVLMHPAVQVVNIAAPNYLHLEIAQAAAEAGKHVFCEKPVGCTPQETAQIEAAARRARVISWVGYNYRWAPMVQFARGLIRDGRLGEITHYRGRFFVGYGSNPNSVLSWRFQRELAGTGAQGDLMSHVVDMAHHLAGPIERLVANQHTFIARRPLAEHGQGSHFTLAAEGPQAEVTNEDYVGALVQFAGGAQGTVEVCRVINGPACEMAFEINGTRGALKWNFERMNELLAFFPDEADEHNGTTQLFCNPKHPMYSEFYPGPANSMSYEDLKVIEAHEFLKSVADKKQGAPGFAEALAVADVFDAMQRSYQSRTWEDVKTEASRG